jgi:hypothetical protein
MWKNLRKKTETEILEIKKSSNFLKSNKKYSGSHSSKLEQMEDRILGLKTK